MTAAPKTSYTKWVDTEAKRKEVLNVVSRAALPFAAHLKRDKRTGKQNNRQWAMLTQVSKEIPWHGQWLSPDDWKIIFLAALHKEVRPVPNLDNDGFVMLGRSSSNLTVSEHSDLTALIEAFASQKGVDIRAPKDRAQDPTPERKRA